MGGHATWLGVYGLLHGRLAEKELLSWEAGKEEVRMEVYTDGKQIDELLGKKEWPGDACHNLMTFFRIKKEEGGDWPPLGWPMSPQPASHGTGSREASCLWQCEMVTVVWV